MGLDIYLIRFVKQPVSELNWLPAAENPEHLARYSEYLTERVVQCENEPEYTENGYYYSDLGYQRKGVKKSFYDRYKPDEFSFSEAELADLKNILMIAT